MPLRAMSCSVIGRSRRTVRVLLAIARSDTKPTDIKAAGVIDLNSSRIIGWALERGWVTDVIFQAMLLAVWRRKPKNPAMINSDQGTLFTSVDWASFLKNNNVVHSMSRH